MENANAFSWQSLALVCLGAALAACSTITTDGSTTYTVNTAKLLSIVTSIESGLTELATSADVASVIGTANAPKLATALQIVAKMTGEVAATVASTVSVTGDAFERYSSVS